MSLECSRGVEQAVDCITVSEVDPLANIPYNWANDIMTYFAYSQRFEAGTFPPRVCPQQPDPLAETVWSRVSELQQEGRS